MTAAEKLSYWKREWSRVLTQECFLPKESAERIINIAELNGMFDPHKTLFAIQDLLS